MRAKYLGRYYVDVEHTQGQPYESSTDVLRHDADSGEIYDLDNLMRLDDNSGFDAYYGESNTSSVMFKAIDCETYRAWRVW